VVAGVKGNLAPQTFLIFEPLMMASLDEPTTEYGLLAEAIRTPDDNGWVEFRLRPEARWHDGQPVTAEDVVFSAGVWRKHAPQWNAILKEVSDVRATGPRTVRFTFARAGDRSLPLYVGQMNVLPKHWWSAIGPDGRQRDIGQTTLEAPLGSGPYRVGKNVPGRKMVLTRVRDYWGARVPIRVGTENFDTLVVEFFRDPAIIFEAFKAGLIDARREPSLKTWAVGYDLPQVRSGQIRRDTAPVNRLGIPTALVFNQRRERFRDWRVRKALALAYNAEEIGQSAFHGLKARAGSYFPRTDFEAKGPISEAERQLFAGLGHEVPAHTFLPLAAGAPRNPHRSQLFRAHKLLQQAGYRQVEGELRDAATGEPFTLDIVLENAEMERVVTAYAGSLHKLGITVNLRVVDDVQYQNRLRQFDFDMVAHAWVQGHAPGNEEREYWTSAYADRKGTANIGGIRNPAVDALVERMIFAPDRQSLVTAGRALDRLLRALHVAIPVSVHDTEFLAYWDRIQRPAALPHYGGHAFPSVWWAKPEAERQAATR
jgi:microcin C transport system substrate-binding protein